MAVRFCSVDRPGHITFAYRAAFRALAEFQMGDLQWESLMIPINLAFFYRDSAADRVRAMSPARQGPSNRCSALNRGPR